MMIKVEFKSELVPGNIKRSIESILPHFKKCFNQRKTYDEYYVTINSVVINLDLEILLKLSSISNVFLTIDNELIIIHIE